MASRPPVRPTYEPTRAHLVSGDLLNKLIRAVSRRYFAGDGIEEIDTPAGIVWRATAVSDQKLLPFEITVTGSELIAEYGVIGTTAIQQQKESSPSDGTWYLEAKVVIDATTGVVNQPSGVSVQWVSAETSDTATDYHYTLARVEVSSGNPDPGTIVQYNYGPILFQSAGGVDNKWIVVFF